jgi:dTMP kinase
VVSDRFLGSTLAYQGFGRGVDLALLREATLLAIGEMRPALTILIDIPLEVANERRARNAEDRFESASLDFHQRVREGFLSLAANEADWVVVDGAQTLADVTRDVDLALDRLAW